MPNDAVLVPSAPGPVKLLLDRVPEFGTHLDEDDLDLPHLAFESFTRFIRKLGREDPILNRVIAFMDELAESGNSGYQNLLCVTVLEQISAEDPLFASALKPQLGTAAAKLFAAAEGFLNGEPRP